MSVEQQQYPILSTGQLCLCVAHCSKIWLLKKKRERDQSQLITRAAHTKKPLRAADMWPADVNNSCHAEWQPFLCCQYLFALCMGK